ncbi:phage tail termination protein [Streptomyces formicae]
MAAVGSVDVEAELVAWLHAKLTVRVLTDLPANLGSVLPVVQLQRIGGDDDTIRLDRAVVDLDVYAGTRQAASALMAQARSVLLSELRGVATESAVFTAARTISAPAWRPYENTSLRRVGGTYEVYSHPVS